MYVLETCVGPRGFDIPLALRGGGCAGRHYVDYCGPWLALAQALVGHE